MAKQSNNSTKMLFVCHGSTCRSPMALYYFKDLVRKKGLEDMFHLDSAAISIGEIGNGVYHGVRERPRQAGISCQGHHARQMTRQDYETYDYLIGMDDWNIRSMNRITGGDPDHKIYRLMGFTGNDRDVADPRYTGDSETTWQNITAGRNALLELIGCTR